MMLVALAKNVVAIPLSMDCRIEHILFDEFVSGEQIDKAVDMASTCCMRCSRIEQSQELVGDQHVIHA